MRSFTLRRPRPAKAWWALAVVLSMTGALAGLLAGGAVAATVQSAQKTFTVKNDTYKNLSHYTTDAPTAGADTLIFTADGSNKGVGHIGAKARIYWDDGTLCQADIWRYNASVTPMFQDWIDSECGGYVYSHGNTAAWNGTSYVTTPTYKSPNILSL